MRTDENGEVLQAMPGINPLENRRYFDKCEILHPDTGGTLPRRASLVDPRPRLGADMLRLKETVVLALAHRNMDESLEDELTRCHICARQSIRNDVLAKCPLCHLVAHPSCSATLVCRDEWARLNVGRIDDIVGPSRPSVPDCLRGMWLCSLCEEHFAFVFIEE